MGITNRKTIVTPCIVKSWLYWSAFSRCWSGRASWLRISSASSPPIRKKANAETPYMIPIFLWSTVVSQLQKPVVAVGRRRSPRGAGTLTLAISSPPSSRQAVQVGRQRVDLVLGQPVVRHLRALLHRVRVAQPRLQRLEVRLPIEVGFPMGAGETLVGRVGEVGQVRPRGPGGIGPADRVARDALPTFEVTVEEQLHPLRGQGVGGELARLLVFLDPRL